MKQIKAKLCLLGTTFILSSCASEYAPLPSHDPSYLPEESYIAIATQKIKKELPEVPVISHAIFHNARNFMSPHWVTIKRNALGRIASEKVYYGFSYVDASSIIGTHYIHDKGSVSITMEKSGSILELKHHPPISLQFVKPSADNTISERPK